MNSLRHKKESIRRTDFVPQLAETECGAVALYSILKSNGVNTSISEIRKISGTGRNGTSLKGLFIAAQKLNANPQIIKIKGSLIPKKNKSYLPSIVRIDGNHFVVVDKIYYNNSYRIVDPARGIYRLSQKSLASRADNIWLSIRPHFMGKNLQIRNDAFDWFRRQDSKIQFKTLYSGILLAIATCSLLLASIVIREILVGNVKLPILAVAATIIAVVTLALGLRGETNLVIKDSEREVKKFTDKLLKLPSDFFNQRFCAEVSLRPQTVDNSFMTIPAAAIQLVTSAFCLIISCLVLILVAPNTIFVVFLAQLMGIFIHNTFGSWEDKVRSALGDTEMQMSGEIRSIILSIEELKGTTSTDSIVNSLNQKNLQLDVVRRKAERIRAIGWKLETTIDATAIFFCAVNVSAVGNLIPVLIVIVAVTQSRKGIIGLLVDYGPAMRIQNRAFADVMEQEQYCQDSINGKQDSLEKEILVQVPSVAGRIVNVHIRKQGITHIVGPSGSGKTTLAHNLLSIMNLRLPGKKNRGYVPDRPILEDGTIRDNLWMGVPESKRKKDEVVWRALEASEAADFVRVRGGLDSVVRLDGKNFSGGEKQRLAMARIFLQKPLFVVLDESVSATNLEMQVRILNRLRNLDIFVINITHELPSVLNENDKIVVL